jgi:hypothetical protein
MYYLASLPVRILLIPVVWAALVVFALFLVLFAVLVPFICLFGTITYKDKVISSLKGRL